jgi:phosphoglycolate phosphatase
MGLLKLGDMNQVLIFDFDGVLANSLAPMLRYAQQVCEELGYPCIPTQNDLEALEKMEFSAFGAQLGIQQDDMVAFVSRNLELFNSSREPLPIVPGMENVVRKLSQSTPLAMITGNSRIIVNKFLRANDLKSEFQIILSVEDEGTRREKILRIIEQYERPHEDCYFIGDAISDIHSARSSGINSVAVGWGHQSMGRLLQGEPDFTVGRPADLLLLFAEHKS